MSAADDGRLTLMPFWEQTPRRKWLIFPVLRVTDYTPPEPPDEEEALPWE